MRELLHKISALRVLVIGDVMLDHYIVGDVIRISPEAPVPVVSVHGDKYAPGAAANVAINVAQLGCETELIGKIGSDGSGVVLMGLLEKANVAFDGRFETPNIGTITKARVVVRGQQLCRIDREGKKGDYGISAELLPEICAKIKTADAVILSDYAKGTLTNSNVEQFIGAAIAGNTFIAMDPKPINRLKFDGISLVTPNRAEAMQLAGIDSDASEKFPQEEICAKIIERHGPENLAVTLGADGILVCSSTGKITQIPTYAKEVFDVCGAGDTSVACLTAALASGETLVRAAKFANIAAGIVVSRRGTSAISSADLLACENTHLLNL
ncbi:MAG: PfkB family carbohydrate kinase [Puniceicoccales bacterium]|jgi:D-beta-D-heptose 7-phosphate kinase/D-beta-D-heptose 1-phosphate adenosyltransferase|nr:PfkB family carbohydrate kinase [Puniceicoccales bacterium]